jgi:hypothetical protein
MGHTYILLFTKKYTIKRIKTLTDNSLVHITGKVTSNYNK